VRDRDARLQRVAGMLGLEQLLQRKPAQLSGGQQQRVALGRAIVAEKPVCLMDEPLSNLDAQLRAEMRREIVALQRRLGLTMIYVTHDQVEAMSMADQVVVMRAGKLEQAAPPDEIYDHPASAFVAGFIGAPPMNLLPLARTAGGMVIDGTDAPVLAPLTDQELLAGIRPEALAPARVNEFAPVLHLAVEHSEYLGADTILTGRVHPSPHRLQARIAGRWHTATGELVALRFDHESLHLFDRSSGMRLQRAPALA